MLLCVGFPPKNTFRRMEELSERCGLSLGVGFRLFSRHESSFTASFNQLSAKDVLTEDFSQITLNIY